MYLQEILEVAIGLVFMWLIMSIAAMTLQEWLANVRNSRAKDLERTIREMLNSKQLARQLYDHPLIASLYRPSKSPRKKARLPSYLPPEKFAAALFELIVGAGTDVSPLKALTGPGRLAGNRGYLPASGSFGHRPGAPGHPENADRRLRTEISRNPAQPR
jgi:hypothetical protein